MFRNTLGATGLSFGIALGSLAFAASEQQAIVSPVEPTTEIITLKIEGWTCASCEKDIRRALLAVQGVKTADVRYASGGAVVEVEPGRVSHEQLVQAVASAGNILSSYRATVVPHGTLTPPTKQTGGWLSWFGRLFGK